MQIKNAIVNSTMIESVNMVKENEILFSIEK